MILLEGSNNIELQYGNAPNVEGDETVTIGITNNNSTDALALVNFDPSLDVGISNRGFLFSTHPVSTHPVPGPLPIFGVGAAFGYSRRDAFRSILQPCLEVGLFYWCCPAYLHAPTVKQLQFVYPTMCVPA
jgi:hypothetical protein